MPKVYLSKEELIKDANAVKGSVADEAMKHTVYLYFIARYLIVAVEARYNKATTQSWKEIRDAFDHYARSLTQDENDTTNHIQKIEGHIQRAALDTCKILCRDVYDEHEQILKGYDKSAIMLVDNGDFIKSLEIQSKKAGELLLCAKTQDVGLGDNTHNNTEILNKFLDAFFAHEALLLKIREKRDAIQFQHKALNYLQRAKSKLTPLNVVKGAIWIAVGWMFVKVCDIVYTDIIETPLKSYVGMALSWIKSFF